MEQSRSNEANPLLVHCKNYFKSCIILFCLINVEKFKTLCESLTPFMIHFWKKIRMAEKVFVISFSDAVAPAWLQKS